ICSRSPCSVNWLVPLAISTQGKTLDLASPANPLYAYQTCVFSSPMAFPSISNFAVISIENSLYFALSFPSYLATSPRCCFGHLASDGSFCLGAGLWCRVAGVCMPVVLVEVKGTSRAGLRNWGCWFREFWLRVWRVASLSSNVCWFSASQAERLFWASIKLANHGGM